MLAQAVSSNRPLTSAVRRGALSMGFCLFGISGFFRGFFGIWGSPAHVGKRLVRNGVLDIARRDALGTSLCLGPLASLGFASRSKFAPANL